MDRLDKELRNGVNRPNLTDTGSIKPGKKAIDRMMRQCREYHSEIAQVKKDVTYTEMQEKSIKEVKDHHIKKVNDCVQFDSTDEEVEAVTETSERNKEMKQTDKLTQNGIIVRDIRSLSQIGSIARSRQIKGTLSELVS